MVKARKERLKINGEKSRRARYSDDEKNVKNLRRQKSSLVNNLFNFVRSPDGKTRKAALEAEEQTNTWREMTPLWFFSGGLESSNLKCDSSTMLNDINL